MKKFLLSLLLIAGVFGSNAQNTEQTPPKPEVKMKYVYSFEEALKKSREENKPIFINWFADWAGPCHGMDQYVFSDQKFADWMDKNFVNLWINAVAGENQSWVKKYDAYRMAQYTVIDKNGDVLFRIVGGHPLPEFQEIVALALDPKTTIPGMDSRYAKGERNQKFLRTYVDVLRYADRDEESNKVLDELFSMIKEKDLPKAENWDYIRYKITSPDSELFKYVVDHKSDFVKNVGQQKVDDLLSYAYFAELFPYASSGKKYDADKMAEMYMGLVKCELPDTNAVFGLYELTKLRGEKKYPELIEAMRKILAGNFSSWAMNLDVTLGDIKELTPAEKKMFIEYLKERSANFERAPYYDLAITNLQNTEGIQFADLTFDEALKKAGEEGKRVFMDCYTTWCGPCKVMNAQVFPNQDLGKYFDKNFIALKMDMEKGEGPELGTRFGISAYPTMLVLDPDGTVVETIVGARSAEKLLSELKALEK